MQAVNREGLLRDRGPADVAHPETRNQNEENGCMVVNE